MPVPNCSFYSSSCLPHPFLPPSVTPSPSVLPLLSLSFALRLYSPSPSFYSFSSLITSAPLLPPSLPPSSVLPHLSLSSALRRSPRMLLLFLFFSHYLSPPPSSVSFSVFCSSSVSFSSALRHSPRMLLLFLFFSHYLSRFFHLLLRLPLFSFLLLLFFTRRMFLFGSL